MGGDLNCNVPRSFAVVMILKRGLQSVKLPLFYVKLKKGAVIPVRDNTHENWKCKINVQNCSICI